MSVNRTIAAAELDEAGEDAAVVSLARNFARRMDSAGDDAPLSLLRSFQTAVKDLQRTAARKAPANPVRNGPERDDVELPVNALAAFLAKWKVGS